MDVSLSKDMILEAFHMLNDELQRMSAKAEVTLFGGAVMCLIFNARETTMDIDAVFAPKEEMYAAIRNVGDSLGLDDGWFNDSVKGFFSENHDIVLFKEMSNLVINTASPRYMFAMKALSCRTERESELEDLNFLISFLGLSNADEAMDVLLEYFPRSRILPKTYYVLKEMFGENE